MKFLICGLGSVGQRHAKNIRLINPKAKIIAFRSTANDLDKFEKEYHIRSFSNLNEAFQNKPTAAFITNPTSLHIPTAISCAKNRLHLFIEKPLSNSLIGVSQLKQLISKKKLVVMIGFMMRYNPGIIKIKQLLDDKVIGQIISAQFTNGEYLPAWHPQKDYKKGYSARKNLGGGIILTFSHEIDLASWLFGKVDSIYCTANKSRILDTNVEDSADILLNFTNQVKVSIHLDHIAQPPMRTLSIIGDQGRIYWDYYQDFVKWYDVARQQWKEYRYQFERNKMFIAEIKEFLDCIQIGKETPLNLTVGIEALRIALKAKSSSQFNRLESI